MKAEAKASGFGVWGRLPVRKFDVNVPEKSRTPLIEAPFEAHNLSAAPVC